MVLEYAELHSNLLETNDVLECALNSIKWNYPVSKNRS